MLSNQELLHRLRRAAQLYIDPAVRERDPYAIKSIGEHILSYVRELRHRGFVVENLGDTFIIHQPTQVVVGDGKLVDEWTMKRRVFWALTDALAYATKKGAKRRHAELSGALSFLLVEWKIRAVSHTIRQLVFEDEPRVRKGPNGETQQTR